MDIVEQLILQTFDDFQQVPTCINEECDNSKIDIPKKNASMENITNEQISIASLNENVLNETLLNEEQPNPKILKSSFVERINSNPNNAEIAVNIPNISAKQCKDSSLSTIIKNVSNNSAEKQLLRGEYVLNNLDENKSFSQSEKSKLNEYDINQILHEPELESCVKETNTIDSLKCSNEFNCNDEFVNTNLLDHPEILKNFGVNSGNTSLFKDNTTVLESKTEDSDIEILENVENERQIVEKKNAEDNINQMMDSESSKKNTETKEHLVCNTSNTTKDKCIPENSLTHSLMSTQQEKPLSLDDIKNTGCAGLELYKCGYTDCSFAALNASLLRAHMKECNLGISNKNLFCPHCKKRFVKIGFLLEHLKAHGLKRFGCSQCKMRYAVSYQATAHMKTKHKFPNTKLVPADPTNPSVDGLFVVHAIVSIFLTLSFFFYFCHPYLFLVLSFSLFP